jgi:hypothetical protein
MITVKASQKIFTCAEVTSLTGICAGHLQNLGKCHRLGFISRTGTSENHADQWLFTSKRFDGSSGTVPALRALVGSSFITQPHASISMNWFAPITSQRASALSVYLVV